MVSDEGSEVVIDVQNVKIAMSGRRNFLGALTSINRIQLGLKALGFKPKSREVLKGISFKVKKGEIFGIIGFNGSGKSTLCDILAGLIPADAGELDIKGKAISCTMDLLPYFKPMENIQIVTRFFDLDPKAVEETARELLKALGFKEEDYLKDTAQLSFGNKAKVAIVRSILISLSSGNESPILILDEPTLGFDVSAVQDFKSCIRDLKRIRPDLTIVIATNLENDLCLCDCYLAIIDGFQLEDEKKLEQLKGLHREYEVQSAEIFTSMIKQGSEGTASGARPKDSLQIKKIDETKSSINPFLFRGWVELRGNPILSIILLISMILPNLYPLFSEAEKTWGIYLVCVLGSYYSWIMRSSYRIIQREAMYFKSINFLLLSKYRGLRHLYMVLKSNLIQESLYAIVFALIFGVCFSLSFGLPDESSFESGKILKFIGFLVCGVLTSNSVGLILSPLMKMMNVENAFFLLSLMPFGVLMFTGFYLEAEKLPFNLKVIAQFFPYSQIGSFIRGNEDIGVLIKCLTLTAIWSVSSLILYKISLVVLFYAKRLRKEGE